MQRVVDALWRDLLAEVHRVSREIERASRRESMVRKRDPRSARPSVAPRGDDPSAADVDQSSEDSFPASDPPAWAPLKIGAPDQHPGQRWSAERTPTSAPARDTPS